jgi:hypothetical protein
VKKAADADRVLAGLQDRETLEAVIEEQMAAGKRG